MSTAISANLSPESLPPLVYKDQPVITSKVLAALYETETGNIRENFRRQKARFTEGKHFFKVKGSEFATLRECVKNPDALRGECAEISGALHALPKGGRELTLWTARGAARHAKMLDTDKAWEVFEVLEDSYFNQKQPAPQLRTDTITSDRHLFLTRLLQSKVNAFPEPLRAKLYAQAWMRFKNKFRIAKIEQLPVERFEDAVEYLTMQVLKLPNAVRQDAPAIPAPEDDASAILAAIEDCRKEWVPVLDASQKSAWAAQGDIRALAQRVRKLAHETDGNNVMIVGNLAQAASDMIHHKAEALCAGVEEMMSLVNMCFGAIATNLQFRKVNKALRDVRRALPA